MIYNAFSQFIKLIIFLILPFILLIRGAVYLHTSSNYLPWVCIFGSGLFTILLIFIYLSYLKNLFISSNDKANDYKRRLIISIAIVLLYGIHGIFYISVKNMKSFELRSEIRKVHPILRLAVSTIMYLDNEIIITDAKRQQEDYSKMGLRTAKHSLHYKQSTGYAHALDLRTKNRPSYLNFLIQSYFKIMGFRTLRHLGTADHLHISLMSHDRPYAK